MKLFILLFLCWVTAFGCGGCVDAPNAQGQADLMIGNYETGDKALAESLQRLLKEIRANAELENTNVGLLRGSVILNRAEHIGLSHDAALLTDRAEIRSE